MNGLLRRWREWRESREEYRASIEEMRFHVEQETEHNQRMGLSPGAARREALKSFGGIDRYAEAARDERPGTRWTEFRVSWLDWKLGTRMLAKYPGMSVISVLTLAVAIGLAAGWFEMTTKLFDPRLPLDDGDRIVRIEYWDASAFAAESRLMHEFVQWHDELASVGELAAYRTLERNLLVPGRAPEIVRVAEMSAAGFGVARVQPMLGRLPVTADEEPGSADVLVIGYAAWQRVFGGDRTVIGREVQLGHAYATIIGVMPEGYRFPVNHEYWVPLRVANAAAPLDGAPISVFGRLRDGATMESARAELAAWGARMAQVSPATHEHLQLRVLPFAAGSNERAARYEAFLLNLAAWLILALACANVAALLFARTALREAEIVVRNAIGASRARVIGQLFTEALVLTSVSAIIGLIGAKAIIAFALGMNAERGLLPPFWIDASIRPTTILYTVLLAIAGAAMIGLLPALRATGRHVRAELAQVGARGTSMRFGGAWSAIIVMQVAFSVLCLPFGIAAALEARREIGLRAAYPADPYLTFRPELDAVDAAATTASDRGSVMDELAQRLLNEPEVAGVAVTNALPGLSHPLVRIETQRGSEPPFLVNANTDGQRVRVGGVGPGFFETFRQPMISGREFALNDLGSTHRVAVINEAMARNIGGNVIGARVRVAATGDEEPGPWHEVIGVVRNFGLTPTDRGEADFMYMPVSAADATSMIVRVNGSADMYAARLRTVAMQVDPLLRLHDVLSLRAVIRREDQGVISLAVTGIAVVLLIVALSAASLYALMSVAVALRTREIGIRVAIGAGSRAVLTSLFRRVAVQMGIGIVVGNVIVLAMLSMMMDVIRPGAVLPPMLAASVAMLLVGLGACLVPARRALRIQPTDALKEAR